MTDIKDIKDTLNLEQKDMSKLPQMLNVLTILTYIGSAFGLLGLIMNLFQDCDDVLNKLDEMPEMEGFMGKLMSFSTSSAEIFCNNKSLLIIAGFLGVALCIYGAMQMRNLKKTGFIMYVIGELVSPIIMLILTMGTSTAIGISGLIIPIIFIILYASQRKHLIH